jgi:hypothetical protein
VANTAMRFNYLAADLMSDFRVICVDWVGRGPPRMADETDYSLRPTRSNCGNRSRTSRRGR